MSAALGYSQSITNSEEEPGHETPNLSNLHWYKIFNSLSAETLYISPRMGIVYGNIKHTHLNPRTVRIFLSVVSSKILLCSHHTIKKAPG